MLKYFLENFLRTLNSKKFLGTRSQVPILCPPLVVALNHLSEVVALNNHCMRIGSWKNSPVSFSKMIKIALVQRTSVCFFPKLDEKPWSSNCQSWKTPCTIHCATANTCMLDDIVYKPSSHKKLNLTYPNVSIPSEWLQGGIRLSQWAA